MFFSVYRGRWPRQGRATSSRWVQTGSWWGWRHSPIWRAYWNGLQYSIAASWRCSQPWSSPTDPGETTTSWRQRSLVSRQTHNTRLLRACGDTQAQSRYLGRMLPLGKKKSQGHIETQLTSAPMRLQQPGLTAILYQPKYRQGHHVPCRSGNLLLHWQGEKIGLSSDHIPKI